METEWLIHVIQDGKYVKTFTADNYTLEDGQTLAKSNTIIRVYGGNCLKAISHAVDFAIFSAAGEIKLIKSVNFKTKKKGKYNMKIIGLKNGNATYRIAFLELINDCRIADNCPNYRKVRFVKLDEADKVITDRAL